MATKTKRKTKPEVKQQPVFSPELGGDTITEHPAKRGGFVRVQRDGEHPRILDIQKAYMDCWSVENGDAGKDADKDYQPGPLGTYESKRLALKAAHDILSGRWFPTMHATPAEIAAHAVPLITVKWSAKNTMGSNERGALVDEGADIGHWFITGHWIVRRSFLFPAGLALLDKINKAAKPFGSTPTQPQVRDQWDRAIKEAGRPVTIHGVYATADGKPMRVAASTIVDGKLTLMSFHAESLAAIMQITGGREILTKDARSPVVIARLGEPVAVLMPWVENDTMGRTVLEIVAENPCTMTDADWAEIRGGKLAGKLRPVNREDGSPDATG